jgi:polyisoprenoid-binding protein YceI
MPMKASAVLSALLLGALGADAAPAVYDIDPAHTYPSFEADHMGLSVWRGKLNKSAGVVHYDKTTGTGTVDVQMELASIDFGLDAMNAWATSDKFFHVAQNPRASYKGRIEGQRLLGELTLNGRTQAVSLTIHQLKCIPHPLLQRELCGADASGRFNRADFGLDAGKDWGFQMEVLLRIQVEAIARD